MQCVRKNGGKLANDTTVSVTQMKHVTHMKQIRLRRKWRKWRSRTPTVHDSHDAWTMDPYDANKCRKQSTLAKWPNYRHFLTHRKWLSQGGEGARVLTQTTHMMHLGQITDLGHSQHLRHWSISSKAPASTMIKRTVHTFEDQTADAGSSWVPTRGQANVKPVPTDRWIKFHPPEPEPNNARLSWWVETWPSYCKHEFCSFPTTFTKMLARPRTGAHIIVSAPSIPSGLLSCHLSPIKIPVTHRRGQVLDEWYASDVCVCVNEHVQAWK